MATTTSHPDLIALADQHLDAVIAAMAGPDAEPRDDQRTAQSRSMQAAVAGPRPQPGSQVWRRDPKGGNEPRQNPRDQRRQQREEEHPPVQRVSRPYDIRHE